MAIRNGAKHKCLQEIITAFAIEIAPKAGKEVWNKAWTRMWCRIHKLGLFPKEK